MKARRISLFLFVGMSLASLAPALRAGIERVDLRVEGMT